MRVPDLEALIAEEEEKARPENRLLHTIALIDRHIIGADTLLNICRYVYGTDAEAEEPYRRSRQKTPDDDGFRVYHTLATILAGQYPGLAHWPKTAVLQAAEGYLESQRAGS